MVGSTRGGQEYESGRANIDETVGERGTHYLQSTSAVGMYPHGASPFGIQDMSGNVWEWCLNSYDDPDYCLPGGDMTRVVRGGSWGRNADVAAACVRYRVQSYRPGQLRRVSGGGGRPCSVALDSDSLGSGL